MFLCWTLTVILWSIICATEQKCTGYKAIYMHKYFLPFPTEICAQNGKQKSFLFDSDGDYIEYASQDCNKATITYSGQYDSRASSHSTSSSCEYSWSYLTIYENNNVLYRYPLITHNECITGARVKLKCLPQNNDLEQYHWDDSDCSGELESNVHLSEVISIFDVSNYTTRTRELQCNVYEPPLVSTGELVQILVGCALFLLCIGGCFFCYWYNKKRQKKRDEYFKQKAIDMQNQNVERNEYDITQKVMVQMPNGQMVTANILPNVVSVPVNNNYTNAMESNQDNVQLKQPQEGQQEIANNDQEYTLQ
eukprot:39507_1